MGAFLFFEMYFVLDVRPSLWFVYSLAVSLEMLGFPSLFMIFAKSWSWHGHGYHDNHVTNQGILAQHI